MGDFIRQDGLTNPPRDHGWRERAECAKPGKAYMFPFDQDDVGVEEAKAVCGACPVRSECLETALATREKYGIWGGMTPDERVNLLRRRSSAAKATNTRK